MKIFVISLVESIVRRESATQQMNEAGVEFEFFDGELGELALKRYFDSCDEIDFLRSTGRTVTLGEIGCYASHLALWKRCVELDEPIIIMEDDFSLLEGFAESVRQVGEHIEEFGYIRLMPEMGARKRWVKACGGFALWRYTRVPHSAMCYGISPTVARAFIAGSRILNAPVDVYVKKFWEHRQLIYGLTPHTVTESQLSFDDPTIAGRQKARKSLKMKIWRVLTKFHWFVSRVSFNLTKG